MTYDEMNQFILNYVKNDRTGRAIMLTGDWGSGKSYYINNMLKPFLESEKNGKYKCVIVSLYGLKELSDISKSIYTELRFLGKKKKSEASTTAVVAGKILCKTILNAVASYKGFEIAQNEDDFAKVYESIDLSEKLIVFEDLERSGIDKIQLLGYINNMTEQDKVKVLLVANENEIIKNGKIDIFTPNNEEKKDEDTDLFIQQYKRIREKTIGDTIYFMYDRKATVTSIVNNFQSTDFNFFHNEKEIKNICDVLFLKEIKNFRTLIFACQKTVDIFKLCSDNSIMMNEQFKKSVFYSLIILSDMLANGGLIKWNGDKFLSSMWGIWYFPVFRFCYDYLQNQTFDVVFIKETISDYNDFVKYDTSASIKDADVDVIYCYYLHTEQEVKDSLNNIDYKLNEKDKISFYEYGKIIYSMFSIKKNLEGSVDINIEKYKSIMLDNLKGHDGKISIDNMFRYVVIPFIDDDEVKQEIELFRQKMNEVLSDVKTPLTGFKYKTDEIKNLSDYVRQNRDTEMEKGKFAGSFDIERFVDMYKKCSSSNLDDIYVMFCQAYYRGNDLVQVKDKENITQLYDKVEQLQNYDRFDTIQKLQCKRFVNTLKTIIEKSE